MFATRFWRKPARCHEGPPPLAAQRLPDDVKARHPEIPWQRIAGFRNILVHDYLGGIDNSLVWRVIQDELPRLKGVVAAELAD
ncbi:HepT-like ribonuclease domain-containing protein [Magnetospirillum moscoviense]|uniref:HepT-like ribonuclease domain-containing protein n=1 Tax=Magnetospirillum moscoviense TaxID=1437059 RepID=UPI0015618525|nr:HepT-like ribonuclease domain-containing protein [Magnetospirillum moscoviense]